MHISRLAFWLRIGTILLAMLTPLACLVSQGYHGSLSMYWQTEMQPLFILSNIFTASYLFSMKNWKLSAVLLILLTAFSIDFYGAVHNMLAVAFFLVTLYPMFMSKRYRIYFWVYLTSVAILPISMFIAEAFAIIALCLYHFEVLLEVRLVQKMRNE